jgi:actin related protein 2/3 complex subunit 4
MATSHQGYYDAVRDALVHAFALSSHPSRKMDGKDRPEIEYQDAPATLRAPVEIKRGDEESCLIESAVNSARVSLKVRQADDLEEILARQFMRFLGRRADAFEILRRVPVDGYDVSFLVLLSHTESMDAGALVDFVVQFMRDIDKEISEQKLSVSSRGRAVATAFLEQFTK